MSNSNSELLISDRSLVHARKTANKCGKAWTTVGPVKFLLVDQNRKIFAVL